MYIGVQDSLEFTSADNLRETQFICPMWGSSWFRLKSLQHSTASSAVEFEGRFLKRSVRSFVVAYPIRESTAAECLFIQSNGPVRKDARLKTHFEGCQWFSRCKLRVVKRNIQFGHPNQTKVGWWYTTSKFVESSGRLNSEVTRINEACWVALRCCTLKHWWNCKEKVRLGSGEGYLYDSTRNPLSNASRKVRCSS